MKLWLTRPGAPVDRCWVKRFRAADWTVDFPRGAMASAVVGEDQRSIDLSVRFLREDDLVGLIYDSEDRHGHPARQRETRRDYSRCVLRFRWRSNGLIPLDAVNGPVLTIEGRDAEGTARSWYVRLWNYATGTPTDAEIALDFDALDAGFSLPTDAVRVWPGDIDRMFFGLVPPTYVAGSDALLPNPVEATASIENLRCEKSGSMVRRGDAWAPEHGLGACTSYDDQYNLPAGRLVDEIEASGFRGTILHYVGMSHYPTLGSDGTVDGSQGICAPAVEWHRAFAREAKTRGYEVIWSLSYELLESLCPDAWKQRAWDGGAAQTGYSPPSTLLSPANSDAMAYLQRVARELVELSVEVGLRPRFQIGEPWWWVRADGAICCFDDASRAALGGDPVVIDDVGAPLNAAQQNLLDQAGEILAQSTLLLRDSVRAAAPDAEVLLLTYLPGSFSEQRPEAKRANAPIGWSAPAFDALQIEDYEWVTEGQTRLRHSAYADVVDRLGYAPSRQHYLAGFAPSDRDEASWRKIVAAADESVARGTAKTFAWAMPQWVRDGVTIASVEDDVQPFEDVSFPIAIGTDASVAPTFSTNIVTSASGHEFRNANWQQARLRFDAGPGVRSEVELGELIRFFRARRGPAVGFRFRDPFDFSSAAMQGVPEPTDQILGEGNGLRSEFALTKSYGAGEVRRISRPVAGSVRVALDGAELVSGWTLEDGGSVRFADPPPVGVTVSAGYLFDVPVRFATDQIEVNRASFLAGEAPSVPLVEVRE